MKTCTICKEEKLLSEFNKNALKKDGLQVQCKACSRIESKEYYAANKEKHLQAVNERKLQCKKENREFIFIYLSSHSCVDCGENDPRCLEFDHVRGIKSKNISSMMKNVCSLDTIKKEIEKCDVRCANCHRKRTSDIQNWYKSLGL